MAPKVSVILPSYNGARFVRKAIDSVLAQTYGDYEVIVVDDGSTDNTYEVLASYASTIHYIRQENQERAVARNNGVAASKGEYIAFLDSDDLLLPHKLAAQVAVLDAQPSVGLVASGYQYIDSDGAILREERPWLGNPQISLETLLFYGLTVIHAVLMRRSWFDMIGGFDPRFSGPEDIDLWFRLSLAGCLMVWEPSIVCQYRIHEHNMSRDVSKHFQNVFLVLDHLFARDDLPNQVAARRDEVYGAVHLAKAGRLYGVGIMDEARSNVEAALLLNPGLISGNGALLAAHITGWERSVWNRDAPRLLEHVLGNLPARASVPNIQRQIRIASAKSGFYRAYERRDARSVLHSWLTVLRQHPGWLLDRGGWSILLQSVNWQQQAHKNETRR